MQLTESAGASQDQPPSRAQTSLRGCRVLVVDDEASVRWSYVGLLREAGARVTEARDGLEALEIARSHRPELIVAAVQMPRLDGLGLCAALRKQPELSEVTVVLLADGEPPQAMWGSDSKSRPLVDALVRILPPARPEGSESESELGSRRFEDASERENARAQSMVAMHRDPANRVSPPDYPVWRLRAHPSSTGAASSGFEWELHAMSRVVGLGFIALLAGTFIVLGLRIARSPTSTIVPQPTLPSPQATEPAAQSSTDAGSPEETEAAVAASPVAEPAGAGRVAERKGVDAFSGILESGVDPSLGVGPGQGVLDLDGPGEVRVSVDGVDRGTLPLVLIVDEGRHRVHYRLDDRSTVRFYYVKRRATRTLRVVTRPGGFVDAR